MYKKEFLIKLLKENNKMDFKQLARAMKVPIHENKKFSEFLFKLTDNGEVFKTPDRFFYVPKILNVFTDPIKLNAKGFGFIDHINEDGSKISAFIPSTNIKTAMDGDIVEVEVSKDMTRPDSLVGNVRRIVTRSKSIFVGRVIKFGEE